MDMKQLNEIGLQRNASWEQRDRKKKKPDANT